MNLLRELESIDELCLQLCDQLSHAESDDANLVETVLRNEELLRRVGQLKDRNARFVQEWKASELQAEPALHARVEALRAKVRRREEELMRICTLNRGRLEAHVNKLGRKLQRVRAGYRYFDTVKSARSYSPRFVDSVA